jgi:hypothetical protein
MMEMAFGFLLKITNLHRDDGDGFWVSLQDDKSMQREMIEMGFGFLLKLTNLCRER